MSLLRLTAVYLTVSLMDLATMSFTMDLDAVNLVGLAVDLTVDLTVGLAVGLVAMGLAATDLTAVSRAWV